MGGLLAAVLALAANLGCASAEPVEIGEVAQGPIYYNRPHSSVAQHNRELAACMATAPIPTTHTQMLVTDIHSGMTYDATFIFDLIWSGPIGGLRAARVENCMLLHGWRAVRLTEAETVKLAALSPSDFEAAMAPLVGGETPVGDVVRVFANDAFRPAGYHTASRPKQPSKDHLSLKLFYLSGGVYPAAPAQAKAPSLDRAWPTRPIKLEAISAAPAGAALILVRATGLSNRYGTGVTFSRLPPTDGDPPSRLDGAPDTVSATTGYMFAKREGNWFILAVAPGRWHIAGSGFVDYCLGSPSFEAKAGDVIYAGTFHLEGPVLGPDLDLAPAREYLAGPLADRIVPAMYRNGASQPCQGFSVTYGLEFPNLPFDPAYDGGSVALSR